MIILDESTSGITEHIHLENNNQNKTRKEKMASAVPRKVPWLYRRALRLSLDWSVRRDIWRPQALAIRQLFEENKHVTDPRQIRALIAQTEAELEKWKHPDPYRPPTAPGGSKFERNLPCPILTPPPPMEL